MTLESAKLALRISHNLLDQEIEETIRLARAEMVRVGVDISVAESDLPCVEGAVKTFVKMKYANDAKLAEGFEKSWQYQLDCLRKTSPEAIIYV